MRLFKVAMCNKCGRFNVSQGQKYNCKYCYKQVPVKNCNVVFKSEKPMDAARMCAENNMQRFKGILNGN